MNKKASRIIFKCGPYAESIYRVAFEPNNDHSKDKIIGWVGAGFIFLDLALPMFVFLIFISSNHLNDSSRVILPLVVLSPTNICSTLDYWCDCDALLVCVPINIL